VLGLCNALSYNGLADFLNTFGLMEATLRTLMILALVFFSANAFAGDIEVKVSVLIAKQFDLPTSAIKVVEPTGSKDYTAYIVNEVTECSVVEYENGDKEIECDDKVILDTKDLEKALGADYKRL
jgi:hypothetical protein